MTTEERFWSKVQKTETCWLWIAGHFNEGYGSFWLHGRSTLAHRFSWIMAFGPIPPGKDVLHRCNNKACVNPAHFYLGTKQQNAADAARDGLYLVGERHPMAKLTTDQINEIRACFGNALGEKAALAREYGISKTHIGRILKNKNWRTQ